MRLGEKKSIKRVYIGPSWYRQVSTTDENDQVMNSER